MWVLMWDGLRPWHRHQTINKNHQRCFQSPQNPIIWYWRKREVCSDMKQEIKLSLCVSRNCWRERWSHDAESVITREIFFFFSQVEFHPRFHFSFLFIKSSWLPMFSQASEHLWKSTSTQTNFKLGYSHTVSLMCECYFVTFLTSHTACQIFFNAWMLFKIV